MSFLLKVVQGPNAGAEVALAEGANLSVGSGDDCDIVLSDASIATHAAEIEVTNERVVVVLSGGRTVKLEPFHVTMLGTTAVVVGPADGPWRELVWPRIEEIKELEAAIEEVAETKSEEGDKSERKRHSFGALICYLFLILILSAIGWAFWKYPEQSKDYTRKGWTWVKDKTVWCYTKVTSLTKDKVVMPTPSATLEEVAKACGFVIVEDSGKKIAEGNFLTRAERLQATARAYAACPGVMIDFADAESLQSAIDELLFILSEGAMVVDRIEGRKAFLSGRATSKASLRKILEAVSMDVPKVTEMDCSQVTVGAFLIAEVDEDEDESPSYVAPTISQNAAPTKLNMPIVGVLTIPYPCLVMANGTRAMEGARLGEYVIEKIEADHVIVRGNEGTLVWRP